ncbi:MAG: DUF305 domain-containing protein [Nanoarchaeota archaeon]|nr:DUF305 domain-containing protein [Nanoarchaeota archaeon]
MYIVMFLNVADISHVYFSLTRVYMTLLMVSPMAITMMLVMEKMYEDKKLNNIIILSSIIVFIFSLYFLRNQTFISDDQYMAAMISHHSSAILTSENAELFDPEVINLSQAIIQAQEYEIGLMKDLLKK